MGYGCVDGEKGVEWFREKDVSMLFITLGAKGCYYKCYAHSGRLSTYDTAAVDTTGAGDAFMGAVLYQIHKCSREDLISRNILYCDLKHCI